MKQIKKKAILIFIFFSLFILLKAEIKLEQYLPQGFGSINITSIASNGHRIMGEKLTVESLKNWFEKGHLKDIESIIGEKDLDAVVMNVYSVMSKGWRDVLRYTTDLLDASQMCPELKNAHSGKAYEEFKKWIRDENLGRMPIIFSTEKSRASSGADTWKRHWRNSDPNQAIHIIYPMQQFKELVEYIVHKMESNPAGDIDISDYMAYKKNYYLFDLLFHEMIHAFTDIFWENYDEIDTDIIECEVYCMQKACLEKIVQQWLPDYKTPSYSEEKCNKKCKGGEGGYCKDGKYEDCKTRPPRDKYHSGGGGAKSGNAEHSDNGDENFSYASAQLAFVNTILAVEDVFLPPGMDFFSLSYYPDLLIYNKFNYPDMPRLLDRFAGFDYIHDYNHDYFYNQHKVLVIPSGELMGDAGSKILKQSLKNFVEKNGTILCLAQQYDSDWELLPDVDGEMLSGPGWRQDQECMVGSCYYDNMEAPLTSLATAGNEGKGYSINTDGYFNRYPKSSKILLRRTKNGYPLALYYPGPNGLGGTIACSIFSDWNALRGRTTTTELRLIRDLVTFAKDIQTPIPLYSLTQENSPQIELGLNIRNNSDLPASKVKVIAFTPDRNKILYQTEQSISLAPGEETTLPITFQLNGNGYLNVDYGICHCDYLLMDTENNPVQMITESTGGRFAVYRETPDTVPTKDFDTWITSSDEVYHINEKAKITLHVKNNKEEPITVYWWHQWFHTGGESLPSLVVGPGEEKEYYLEVEFPQYLAEFTEIQAFFHLRYKIDPAASYKTAKKGFRVKGIQTRSTIKLNTSSPVAPGGSLNYTIHSAYITEPLPGNAGIRVSLEKGTWNKLIYETTHDYSLSGVFAYTGTYTPETVHTSGPYRLKLEVIAANGVKEQERYHGFAYNSSRFGVILEKVSAPSLVPGDAYELHLLLKNPAADNTYTVQNGSCIIVLRTPEHQEIYRREISPITLAPGEEQPRVETFTFNPLNPGRFILEYAYTDETRSEGPYFREVQRLWYGSSFQIEADKPAYDYGDTALTSVIINGAGLYQVVFDCPQAGIHETRNTQIPAGSFTAVEVFQVPIVPLVATGINPVYDIDVEIRDAAQSVLRKNAKLAVRPITLDCTGTFSEPHASSGTPLHFELNLKGISGFSQPLTGQLMLSSPGLNYEHTQTVVLQPRGDNVTAFEIPISPDLAEGFFHVALQLKVNDVVLVSRQYPIQLPGAKLQPRVPNTHYNAGDTLEVTLENSGGKTGEFNIQLQLKDKKGQPVRVQTEHRTLGPGESSPVSITIPTDAGSGQYVLLLEAVEIDTQKNSSEFIPLQVSGLSALLNSYTLQENYFDTQLVEGKAEITMGNFPIANGTLLASIVKFQQSSAFEWLADSPICLTGDHQGRLWIGTESGVSVYDGSQWQDFETLPGGIPMGFVYDIAAAPNGAIYAAAEGGIVKINGGSVSLVPPAPQSIGYCNLLAVDTLGRLWTNYYAEGNQLYYYDDGAWHEYSWDYLLDLISDGMGGLWLSQWNGLVHIKADLSREEFTSTNSGLPDQPVRSMYVTPNHILWFTYGDDYDEGNPLFSFDGTTWTDYSTYPGHPPGGAAAVTGDTDGNIYVIGEGVSGLDSIHRRDGNQFTPVSQEFEMEWYDRVPGFIALNDDFYTTGSFGGGEEGGGDSSPSGLLKIGGGSSGEQKLWSQSYPLDLEAGSSSTLDLTTGKSFTPGVYTLKTQVISSLDQVPAESRYDFVVRDSAVSVSLLAGPSPTGFVKAGTPIPVTVEMLNNTAENQTGVILEVRNLSPTGAVEEILSETLDLQAGQRVTRSLTFEETLVGAWLLTARLSAAGEGEGATVIILSEAERVLRVAEPVVNMEITAPPYAGAEPFDMKIKLFNDGNLPVEMRVTASREGNSESLLEETLTLNPLEQQVLTLNDTISSDRVYQITLSGEVEKTVNQTVQYGYVEAFSIDILPVYREGAISIPFRLENQGGLAFVDEIEAECYAVGGTVPLVTLNRGFHLYPGQPPISDTLDFQLPPGAYELKYRSSYQSGSPTGQVVVPFSVQPSGIGTIALTSGPQYPVGPSEITYAVTNTDTFAGYIPVTVTLVDPNHPANPLPLAQSGFYLAAGETRLETIPYEFTASGNYTLGFQGAKLAAPLDAPIQVIKMEEATATLTLSQLEAGAKQIPIGVSLENTGYQTFTGTMVIEVESLRHQEPLTVASGSSFNGTVGLGTEILTPGSKEVTAFLLDSSGNPIAQTTGTVVIRPAHISLVEFPDNLEITAGSFGSVTLKLKNQGNLGGDALLTISAFDTLHQERELVLEPGEEIQLNDIVVEAPQDLPTGNYPFYYTLSGSGVGSGMLAGNFNFKVNGLSLDVDASLDRSLYNPGETAGLTLEVQSAAPTDAPLEAMVNWGDFSETRVFNLSSGSAALVFDIPLEEKRDEKIFYGIYHEGGKGIHLNDIYLNFRGEISVELDKQVYQPGEIVHAVFTGQQPGVLTVGAFGETYTLNFSSSASASFQVPGDTLGGTYGIAWDFEPADPAQAGLSGSQPFDVSGLVVKVAKSQLERGKYAPGETLNAHYIFESNRDQVLDLRCWVNSPSGDWTYLGESSVTVSSQQQTDALTGYSFSTTEAGTHELVYGLYQNGQDCDTCDTLVVSGRLSFDVGDAVLLGISTDRGEYRNGNEPVALTIDYFGQGAGQLTVSLDGVTVRQQGITLTGMGSTTLSLESSLIGGGTHVVNVILTQNGLTSGKTTGFTYGTDLPDLVVSLGGVETDGLNYTYTIEVANQGKTASSSTSLAFSDNGTQIQTITIPSLPSNTTKVFAGGPGGQYFQKAPPWPPEANQITIQWNGTGKAGTHEMVFELDSTDTVKEFSETNNRLEFTEEVPSLFYNLAAEPLRAPANTPVTITSCLINNQDIPALLNLALSITNDQTGVTIHTLAKEETLPVFGGKTLTDTFNTAVYPAGQYTLRQTLSNDNVNMSEEQYLSIEPTPLVSGTLQAQPQQIPSQTPTDVQLTLTLKNSGNIDLESEMLHIDVFNLDAGEVTHSEELTVSIPLTQEITETKILTLNLPEGNYEIWLKHHEEIIALTELAAASAVKPSQKIAVYPRVLIMDLMPPAARGAFFEKAAPLDPPKKLFIEGLLQSQGIEFETGRGVLNSYVKFHKGQCNVNVVLGNEIGNQLHDELKERVYHGEGLILVCTKPNQNPEWADFLGVKIKPITGRYKETTIQLIPNDLTPGGEAELSAEIKLQLIKEHPDALVIAETRQKKYPVITYYPYGQGHILVMTTPLQFTSGAENISQLLLNAVNHFNQDIFSNSDLTRLLPIEISLENQSPTEKTATLKTLLPYGVETFDYKPKPEAEEELQWQVTIPATSATAVFYWLKLPDKIDTYEIKTELYEAETKQDEISISFDVTQTVLFRINELIDELGLIEARGKDSQLLRKAKHHLEKIRTRPGNSLITELLNLHDAVQAASDLGKVEHMEISILRIKVLDIMAVMGRRFYEAVKTWGETQLSPFLNQMNE